LPARRRARGRHAARAVARMARAAVRDPHPDRARPGPGTGRRRPVGGDRAGLAGPDRPVRRQPLADPPPAARHPDQRRPPGTGELTTMSSILVALRHLRDDRAPAFGLAVLVLVTATVFGVAPRLIDQVGDDALHGVVAKTNAFNRNIALIEESGFAS